MLDKKHIGINLQIGFANIISGVRRCGKSTFMRQLLTKVTGNSLFLNFEDPRLSGFDTDHFRRLNLELKSRKTKNLFLNEIQMFQNWDEKKECDFVVFDNGKIKTVVQACYEVNQDNLKIEINGIVEALDFFGLKT